MTRFLRLLALLAISSAISQAAEATTEIEDRAAIARQSAAFSAAFVANDGDALAACYTADGKIYPPNRTIVGRAAIKEFFAWRPGRRQIAHRMESESLRIDGNTAVDVGTWHSTTQSEGHEPVSFTDRYLVVWVRESDGVWRMLHDIWHNAPPKPRS
ncbi:MAG: hypothetical protein C0518_16335 [Opitutus sp.]|nr:hypothetical protein [Opitutus sp.]